MSCRSTRFWYIVFQYEDSPGSLFTPVQLKLNIIVTKVFLLNVLNLLLDLIRIFVHLNFFGRYVNNISGRPWNYTVGIKSLHTHVKTAAFCNTIAYIMFILYKVIYYNDILLFYSLYINTGI